MKLIVCMPRNKAFPQVNTIIFNGCGQVCLKYPNNKFAISVEYLKNEVFFLFGKLLYQGFYEFIGIVENRYSNNVFLFTTHYTVP